MSGRYNKLVYYGGKRLSEPRPDNVIPGWRLFYIMPRPQVILESKYRAVAEKFGIEFIGPVPKNTSAKTIWKCAAGHEWGAAYCNVSRGAGATCRKCVSRSDSSYRLGEADYVQRGRELGFVFIGPVPKYTTDKTNWKCTQGHVWMACLHSITGCPECVRIQPAEYLRMASGVGLGWIGPYPKRTDHRTFWTCPVGHIFSDTYENIKAWPNCPVCPRKNGITAEDYFLLGTQKKIKLVGKIPQNSRMFTEWECDSGHIFFTAYQTIRAGRHGNGCQQCAAENRSGSKSPLWMGGRLEDTSKLVSQSKIVVRRRDGFRCQICHCKKMRGGPSLDVHHIIPRKFSEFEFHYDIENMITLCKKHHLEAEHNLIQSIPLLRFITERKYGYDYPHINIDLEHIYECLLSYPESQGHSNLNWKLLFPATFLSLS